MGAQGVVQLLTFVSGLLVIRLLAPEQYAYYTIAQTVLGAMTVLSDSGLSSGVLAQGGRVWQNPLGLGTVLQTGLAMRRRIAAAVVVVMLPVAYLLMRHQAAPVETAVAVTLSIVPLFAATLTTNLLEVVPRLHQQLLPLQRIQLGANVGRLLGLAAVLPLLPYASAACVVAAVPQLWVAARLRRQAARHADPHAPNDREVRRALLGQVRRLLPLALYYALSGQLTVLLVSVFGSTHEVAALGALGRLAMVLSAVGAAFTMIALPRFARIPPEQHRLISVRYWQAQGALVAVCAVPMLLLAAFPAPVLAVLGPSYSGLEHEAQLFAASTVITSLSGAALALGAARDVITPSAVAVPYAIAVQVVLIMCLPVDTIAGVIWVSLGGALAQWVLNVGYFMRRRAAGA
jgi:O-antigen/teichoic acid export membrane protein